MFHHVKFASLSAVDTRVTNFRIIHKIEILIPRNVTIPEINLVDDQERVEIHVENVNVDGATYSEFSFKVIFDNLDVEIFDYQNIIVRLLKSKSINPALIETITQAMKDCKSNRDNLINKYEEEINFIETQVEEIENQFLETEENHQAVELIKRTAEVLARINALSDKITDITEVNKNKDLIAWLSHCSHILTTITKKLKRYDVDQSISEILDVCKSTLLQTQLQIYVSRQSKTIISSLNCIRKIILLMKKNHLMNDENLPSLVDVIQNMDLNSDKTVRKLQTATDSMRKLSDLSLLTKENFSQVITGTHIDKSCLARTNCPGFLFFGNAGGNDYENKVMWSYYCVAIEVKVSQLIVANAAMADIFDYVRNIRHAIALKRNEDIGFGEFRNVAKGDRFSSGGSKSVVNPRTFPSIQDAVAPLINAENWHGKSSYSKSFPLTVTTISGDIIMLPAMSMQLFTENVDTVASVVTFFQAFDESQFNHYLTDANVFLNKIRSREYDFQQGSNEPFLIELGRLAFHMCRFYPLNRGTGAVVQCIIRGIVKAHTNGAVDLGDIRIGNREEKENNVPYDVYAQLIQNADDYAKAFQVALMPELAQGMALTNRFASK